MRTMTRKTSIFLSINFEYKEQNNHKRERERNKEVESSQVKVLRDLKLTATFNPQIMGHKK